MAVVPSRARVVRPRSSPTHAHDRNERAGEEVREVSFPAPAGEGGIEGAKVVKRSHDFKALHGRRVLQRRPALGEHQGVAEVPDLGRRRAQQPRLQSAA